MAEVDDEDPIGTAIGGAAGLVKEVASTVKGVAEKAIGEIKGAIGDMKEGGGSFKDFLGGGKFKGGSVGEGIGKDLGFVQQKASENGIQIGGHRPEVPKWTPGQIPKGPKV